MAPAVVTLFLWMIVPLAMTIYFSLVHYNLMQPGETTFLGLSNFEYFVTDPDFGPSVLNTLSLLGSVIAITVVLGIALALLVNDPFPGRGIVRVLIALLRRPGQRCWGSFDDEPDLWRLAQSIFFGASLVDYHQPSALLHVGPRWQLPFRA